MSLAGDSNSVRFTSTFKCLESGHAYQKFDDERLFCAKCGYVQWIGKPPQAHPWWEYPYVWPPPWKITDSMITC